MRRKKAARKRAPRRTARPARKATRKAPRRAAARRPAGRADLPVARFGQAVQLTYRKGRGGPTYAHPFKGASVYVTTDAGATFLVIGPVRIRAGQIED